MKSPTTLPATYDAYVIDRSTGTIRARAQFVNSDGLFTPGMFARVQVPVVCAAEGDPVPLILDRLDRLRGQRRRRR